MTTACDILAEDPGMSRKALLTKAKSSVSKRDTEKRRHHAKSLKCQGQVFRCCEQETATIWATAVQQLLPELLKFSLNAVQDTLPHNDSLSRWRKKEGLSSNCKLCGGKQTLLHVLNNCPRALNLRRYNERHDKVLEGIANFITDNLPENYKILADLPGSQAYLFPPHIATTDVRPDIVVWNDNIREVWVFELTVCFETGIDEAHNRKMVRYSDLMEMITAASWDGSLVTLEVGSPGFLSLPRFTTLKQQLTCICHSFIVCLCHMWTCKCAMS